jgi:hypothetical protein
MVVRLKSLIVRRLLPHRFWESRRRRFAAQYLREIEELRPLTDVFIVSYPKCGRTWHRILLGSYIAARREESIHNAADVEKLTSTTIGCRIRYTHNSANFVDGLLPEDPLVATPELWRGKKVIFILREPKDTLVSAWFHACNRYQIYRGPLSKFIRERRVGAEKLATAMNRWWHGRGLASNAMVTSYEAISHDAGAVLRRTLAFLGDEGLGPLDPQLIERCVDASRFDRMQQLESTNVVDHGSMRTATADPGGRKVREGRIGGFRRHMSARDIAFVDDLMAHSAYAELCQLVEDEMGTRPPPA